MEPTRSILFIVAKPISRNTYSYTINGNTQDSHSMNNDSFYQFICSLVKPPATQQVARFIQTFTPFILNVSANEARKLVYDKDELEQEMINNFKKIKKSEVLAKAMEDRSVDGGKTSEEKLITRTQTELDNLFKRLTGIG